MFGVGVTKHGLDLDQGDYRNDLKPGPLLEMTFPQTKLVRASNEPLISVIAVVPVEYPACQARI